MENDFYYLDSKGCAIEDEEQSRIMFKLMELHPHKAMFYTWDDIGSATLMKDVYEENIRFCPQSGDWYIHDGSRWERQGDVGIASDMLQTLLNLLVLYCKEIDFNNEDKSEVEIIENYQNYIKSVRKNTAMRNILEVLKTMVRMPSKDMNRNPYILNTPRCAYDLKTGKMIDNIIDCNITMKTTCSLPNANQKKCKRWYQFVDEVMSGDKEKAAFLQRALGYSLLGVNREECMFMMYGSQTRNGKGTLIKAIENVLGEDYANNAPTDLICESKTGRSTDFNAPQPTLARLVGTRLVTMSESPKDVRLDAAAMKAMTGRDSLVTRGLYEASFTFTPQFTLWLQTNHLPAVTDDTVFMSDRIWVIEFNEQFDENKRDKGLKELFSDPDNKPTVLKWLFDGCMDYMKNGLNPPECVREATRNYRKMHDRIGNFISELCVVGGEEKVLRGELFSAYSRWCMKPDNRYKPVGSTTFYNEIAMRGYPVRKTSDWYVCGLSIKPDVLKEIQLV